MKSVFLSIVIICALAIAGIGGTFAGYSDTDMAVKNTLTTGTLDLKIWQPGTGWVDRATGVITVDKINPCNKISGFIRVWNAGDCPDGGQLWIKIKDMSCCNVSVTHRGFTWWKPEPERVSEFGGVLNQCIITHDGVIGDNCSLRSAMEVKIYNVDGGVALGWTTMINWAPGHPNNPGWVYLGTLPSCVPTTIELKFHLMQIPEDSPLYGGPQDFFCEGSPFEYWKTNGLMADKLTFSVEFALLQDTDADPNDGDCCTDGNCDGCCY